MSYWQEIVGGYFFIGTPCLLWLGKRIQTEEYRHKCFI